MIATKVLIYKSNGTDDPIVDDHALLKVTDGDASRVEIMFSAGGRDHYLRFDLADLLALVMRGEPSDE